MGETTPIITAGSGLTVCVAPEALQAGHGASAAWKQRTDTGSQLAFSFLFGLGNPDLGKVLPTARVDLPTLIKTL